MKRVIWLVLCGLAFLTLTISTGCQGESELETVAEIPPLVDRELFFGDPEISGDQLSRDGQWMSFIKPYEGARNIWIKAAFLPAFVDSFGLSIADGHDFGSFLKVQGVLSHLLENMPPVGFLSIQDYKSLHVVHLHEGDIFSLQLQGTKPHC